MTGKNQSSVGIRGQGESLVSPPLPKYFHLIGGEANGIPHEVGDPVDASTPPRQLKEWLEAKIISSKSTKSTPRK